MINKTSHLYLDFYVHDVILGWAVGIRHYFIEQNRLDLEITELADITRTHDRFLR